MRIDWGRLVARYDTLSHQLTQPGLESAKRNQLQKEYAQLASIVEKKKEIDALAAERESVITQITQQLGGPEYTELFKEEAASLNSRLSEKERELEEIMVPENELDNRSVYLEIRAGTGGQEAALFAGDLLRLYTNYALKKGWKVSIESESSTDLGGYREIIMHIQGKDVYSHLKRESGVHRVQRVPATETQGRVHTSTVTVAVLPEAQEMDAVAINPADLRIDVFRSSGAGGQHVNTTDSAVRITHLPTNVVVTCQDERSQHKNKAKALKMLQSRLLVAQMEAREAELSKQRKEQVGTGDRSEKIRTYNFPQNRISDHQVDMTLQKLDIVMQGALDEIVDALRERDRQLRRERFLSQFM